MSTIHLTINGQEVTGETGQTVLDVCRKSGIHIPTLCQYEGLSNIGACRLCIVEIEGQRRPVPSCTTPAVDRMVLRTETPQLETTGRRSNSCFFRATTSARSARAAATANCRLPRTSTGWITCTTTTACRC